MNIAYFLVLSLSGCSFSGEVEPDLECVSTCENDQKDCVTSCETECANASNDSDEACDTDCNTACTEEYDKCEVTCTDDD